MKLLLLLLELVTAATLGVLCTPVAYAMALQWQDWLHYTCMLLVPFVTIPVHASLRAVFGLGLFTVVPVVTASLSVHWELCLGVAITLPVTCVMLDRHFMLVMSNTTVTGIMVVLLVLLLPLLALSLFRSIQTDWRLCLFLACAFPATCRALHLKSLSFRYVCRPDYLTPELLYKLNDAEDRGRTVTDIDVRDYLFWIGVQGWERKHILASAVKARNDGTAIRCILKVMEEDTDVESRMAAINYRCRHVGYGALHYAAVAGNVTAVKALLDCGANASITTHAGHTALDLATEHCYGDIMDLLEAHKWETSLRATWITACVIIK
jgi:hypothetical protein